jgi:hypothetical protein
VWTNEDGGGNVLFHNAFLMLIDENGGSKGMGIVTVIGGGRLSAAAFVSLSSLSCGVRSLPEQKKQFCEQIIKKSS